MQLEVYFSKLVARCGQRPIHGGRPGVPPGTQLLDTMQSIVMIAAAWEATALCCHVTLVCAWLFAGMLLVCVHERS
jgi:hypothetical protein